MNQTVLEYIRANRSRYTAEAINARLREEGHTDADIEEAWQAIRKEDALAAQTARARAYEAQEEARWKRGPSRTKGLLNLLLALAAIVVVFLLCYWIVLGICQNTLRGF